MPEFKQQVQHPLRPLATLILGGDRPMLKASVRFSGRWLRDGAAYNNQIRRVMVAEDGYPR